MGPRWVSIRADLLLLTWGRICDWTGVEIRSWVDRSRSLVLCAFHGPGVTSSLFGQG